MPQRSDRKPEAKSEWTPAITRRSFLAASGATLAALTAGCAGQSETLATFPVPKGSAKAAVVPRKPGTPEPILLANVRLLDVEAGTCEPVEGVLVRDGRIAEVFGRAPAPLSLDVRRVDLKGDVLAPGLIDAHVHCTMGHVHTAWGTIAYLWDQVDRNLYTFVENGVTTVRDMCSAPRVLNRRILAIHRGQLPGPRVIRCDSFVQKPGGYPAMMKPFPPLLSQFTGDPMIWVRNPQEAREAVRRLRGDGAQLIKTAFDSRPFTLNKDPIPVLDDETIDALREEATRQGMPLASHHTHLESARVAARHRVDTLEHLPSDGVYTDEDLRMFQDAGLTVVPTFSVGINLAFEREGTEPAGPLARRAIEFKTEFFDGYGDRFMVPGAKRESKKAMEKYLSGRFTAKELDSRLLYDGAIFVRLINEGLAPVNIARLREAGIPLGCGTDAGTPFDYAGNIALELYLANAIGKIPAPDVIRSVTIGNARALGIADEVGSIAPGKVADLVVLAGDPLQDVLNYRKIRAVYQEGAQTVARGPEDWITIAP